VLVPLLLLAGCGQGKEQAKEQSTEELLKEVISNQKQLKSGKLHMIMNFKAAVWIWMQIWSFRRSVIKERGEAVEVEIPQEALDAA